ncbi:MAG: protein-L-isoaspartate(D-aspartate) O-methyltransferase [Pseudomonadota bacterium]
MNSLGGIGMTSARTRERLISRLKEQGVRSPSVLARIRDVPRHIFVDEALASRAYEDTALPIGLGQTISQPYIVARMTEALLEDGPLENVLEVGTGCGYQTAVLSPLVKRIFSIEYLPALLHKTKRRLGQLDLYNIRYRQGDGWLGWPKYGPYDGIIVAAAPELIPTALLEQLAPNGRLILPLGPPRNQRLLKVTRVDDDYKQADLGPASFVPLVKS